MPAKKSNSDKVPNTKKPVKDPVTYTDKPLPEKGKPKPVPQDQPTRKSISDLLRQLAGRNYRYASNPELGALDDRIEARTKAVLDADDELQDLYAKQKEARTRADTAWEKRHRALQSVQSLFLAQGVTPLVVKKVTALVAEFFPETVEQPAPPTSATHDDQGTND